MYKVYVDGELLCNSQIDELAIINPNVSLEVNAAGTFSFMLTTCHPKYDLIKLRKSVISVFRDKDKNPLFQGIAVREEVDFFKQKTISCEGELVYLNDSVLRPSVKEGYSVRNLLEDYISEHNSQVEDSKKFLIGNVTVKTSNSISTVPNYTDTFSQIKDDLIEDIGGYMTVRYEDGKKYIDYLSLPENVSNQKIELGLNLIDYTSNLDSSDFATILIPLGGTLDDQIGDTSQRLTIASVNAGKDYITNSDAVERFGMIQKVVVFDEITDAEVLKTKGEQYLRDTQFDNVYIEVKAIDFGYLSNDFSKFKLADKVRVVSTIHGVDKYFMLAQMNLSLNEPENDVFVFTSATASRALSTKKFTKQIQEDTSNAIEDISASVEDVERNVENVDSKVGGLTTRLTTAEGNITAEVIRATGAEDTITSRLTVAEGEISSEVTRASKAEGELGSRITQTATEIASEVTRASEAEGELGTKISQTAHSISLSAKGGNDSVGIEIRLYDANGNKIDEKTSTANIIITGVVKFEDLEKTGSTKINGANITTGQISAERIDVSKLRVSDIKSPDGKYTGLTVTNSAWVEAYHTWDFSSDVYMLGVFNNKTTSSPNFHISNTGYLNTYSGSSERFKHDITTDICEELNPHKLYDVSVYQYKYNLDYIEPSDTRYNKDVIGFIAEDLDKHYKCAVEYDEDGLCTDWGEKYIIPPMLALIQEQHKEIVALKREMQELKEIVQHA